jgi:hypothetical protein
MLPTLRVRRYCGERRAYPEQVAAAVDHGELAHPVVGVLRRHDPAPARGVGHDDRLPVVVERLSVVDEEVAAG